MGVGNRKRARSLAGWARFGFALVGALFLPIALFVGATLVGALARSAATIDADGSPVTIYVASNGFHSDIIVPARSEAKDWSDLLKASPFSRARAAEARWVAFGWGSEAAYTRLGTIFDLTPAIALKALAFDRSVMHVAPYAGIGSGEGIFPVRITEDGYRRLVAAIDESFARDERGRPVLLEGTSHGRGDAFFRSRQRFSLLRSCNVWTGDVLRRAGVRTGIWTPFAQALVWSAGLD